MAGYIARVKSIVGNLKSRDQTGPADRFVGDLAKAFVCSYAQDWQKFISSPDNKVTSNESPNKTVVNPENTADMTDIGLWNNETKEFTGASQGEKNRLLAAFYLRCLRKYHSEVWRSYRLQTATIETSDAGKTAVQLRDQTETAIRTESKTEFGDSGEDGE